MKRTEEHTEELPSAIEISIDKEAINHLLRVTSGLESMIIGEEQVINQVWLAYLEAEKAKTTGPVLEYLFNRSMSVGRRVRTETGISKGAVSVGGAAVELAANLYGSLNDEKILVLGAGEMGTLVAKSLARRCQSPIFIASRTYERAVELAKDVSGRAVKLDQFEKVLMDADLVVCATSRPNYLLYKDDVLKIMKKRTNKKDLIIIDISVPRNIEKSVEEIEAVKLFNIDDLQLIAEKNKMERMKSIDKRGHNFG